MLARPRLPFDIDDAKLSPPRIRSTPVKKTEAIATLVASVAPCVAVSAPAVYGKTTPLGRSAEDDPRRFAWVSLDARDDDPLGPVDRLLARRERHD